MLVTSQSKDPARTKTLPKPYTQPHARTPLGRTSTNRTSPAIHPAASSTRESSASRASSLASSPLDDVPERLWDRVLRSSSATETNHPCLSLDDITSTRLSLDEQMILSSLSKSSSDRKGDLYGSDPHKGTENRFKSLRKKLKHFPSGIFSRTKSPTIPDGGRCSYPSPLKKHETTTSRPTTEGVLLG